MKNLKLTSLLLLLSISAMSQDVITPPENVVAEGIPILHASLAEEVSNYTEFRGASLAAWHPSRKEILISTRFGNSNQLHYVISPGGMRKQITFFQEPVQSGSFPPIDAGYFLFLKDIGGNEFTQIFRYDLATKNITLLTDGKRSQNGQIQWSNKGDRIAYGSTSRNGKDRDTYIINPTDSSSRKLVAENDGGGWSVLDWSPDDAKLLLQEYLSINESRLYVLDLSTGIKARILPEKDERTRFAGIGFAKNGQAIYLTTNKDGEFNSLALYDIPTGKMNSITTSIPWDVDDADMSRDRSKVAFATNENGSSRLYVLSTSTNRYIPVQQVPSGVIENLRWSGDSESLGFTLTSYNSSSDVYEFNTRTNKLIRWTESETGGMDVSLLKEPEIISWKSFDERTISGYLYRASSKFTGKRPVVISIHGGPEGQFRPVFIGRSNYYLSELGISMIFPNVRGSAGYGKSFVDMDNGLKREESVKDIGALIDWIGQQPDLDKDRIMIMGGSYGGYMTLAASFLYSDLIRCSVDIVGISNFNTFLKNTESYRRDLRRAEYGDERDPKMAAFFESISPSNHTDRIKKPLFIIQGGNDPRVPYTESIQMKEKIKQQGGTVWFLMAKDEGHGFRKKNNVDFQFYSTVEFIRRFLLN